MYSFTQLSCQHLIKVYDEVFQKSVQCNRLYIYYRQCVFLQSEFDKIFNIVTCINGRMVICFYASALCISMQIEKQNHRILKQ